jgi:hypothetical protein
MNIPTKPYITCLAILVLCFNFGCKKEVLDSEEKKLSGVTVYDDNSIRIPLDIVAGNGFLLSAYHTWEAPFFKFMLTDNNGEQRWTKDFGLTSVSGMLAEMDGTFTIFDSKRLINIDVNGTILKDVPDFLSVISGFKIVHVTLNRAGNYFMYGSIAPTAAFTNYAFAYEITPSGVTVFKKIYVAGTSYTGCSQTTDGGYLFLGNRYFSNPTLPTKFFVCKMSSTGTINWINYHTPPGKGLNQGSNDLYTHDIIESNDGNYFCFVGNSNTDIDHVSRVYKLTPEGNLLDSLDINVANKNILAGRNKFDNGADSYPGINGYCSVKKSDGTYEVYLNKRTFEETIPNSSFKKGNQSYTVHFNDDLSINYSGNLQNSYTDYFTSVCLNSDGRTVAFGFISSFGNRNKPILLIYE